MDGWVGPVEEERRALTPGWQSAAVCAGHQEEEVVPVEQAAAQVLMAGSRWGVGRMEGAQASTREGGQAADGWVVGGGGRRKKFWWPRGAP